MADDEKFVFYEEKKHKEKPAMVARQRIVTADEVILQTEIDKQKEYRQELTNKRELNIVEKATIDDLDIDKINNYIQLGNAEVKTQNLLTNQEEVISYCSPRLMCRDNMPTILGMLFC